MNIKKITTLGVLCSLAVIANLVVSFPIIPAVAFLRYDPKDIIIVIGGFIYGPLSAMVMSLITSFIEVLYRNAGGNILIDILMNVISTCSLACIAAYYYKKHHDRKGAIKGLLIGAAVSILAMCLWNYIVTPIYYGMPRSVVAAMILPGILPFNLIKNGINVVIVIYLYKPIVNLLRRNNLANIDGEGKMSTAFLLFGAFALLTIVLLFLVHYGIIK
ncbi:MAG: ECF transporter S component [Erysipelotrichaceae bacterium]|nr:ECF transporter S component [Erysipelotrichaceae bacterium]MDY5252826.1 ECF transporter S component [Erysipelotrichaceae bacterium]